MCNYKNSKLSDVDWINYKKPLLEEDDDCFYDDNEMPEWWDAGYVFENLGIFDQNKALSELDSDEKQSITASAAFPKFGQPNSIFIHSISSSALLYFMMCSPTPLGRKFRRWVTHKVLPAILFGSSGIEDISMGAEELMNEVRFSFGIREGDANVKN
jgi:prophage antirepressor-like protein